MDTWTPADVVTVIAALSAFAVSVINALKTTQAKTQGDGHQQRINAMAEHLRSHDQQLTTLALNTPPPGGTAVTVAPASVPPALNGLTTPSDDLTVPNDDLIAPRGGDVEEPQ